MYDQKSNTFNDLTPAQLTDYTLKKDPTLFYSFTRAINEMDDTTPAVSKLDPTSVAYFALLQSQAANSHETLSSYLSSKFKRS